MSAELLGSAVEERVMRSEWRGCALHTFDSAAGCGTARSAAPAREVLAGAQNDGRKCMDHKIV